MKGAMSEGPEEEGSPTGKDPFVQASFRLQPIFQQHLPNKPNQAKPNL